MKPDRDLILREMGLGPVWRLRAPAAAAPAGQGASATTADAGQAQASAPAVVPAAAPSALAPLAAMAWDELASTVAACRQCRLCEVRQQAVLGVGDRNADWLFVGEGPGAEEDARGEPFVGQAGKLLDNMLAAIGLRRGEDVYIANAVKCRPPENRTPTPEETALCRPYLERQIELLRPRLIVALGRPAAQTLLQDDVKIGAARGKLHDYRGIPLIVSYHPAYLLRTPQDKARAWEDLCFMRRTMRTQKDR
jgi:DNA polymerase